MTRSRDLFALNRPVKKVLYVRLPVWKIYPGGVVYIADYLHKRRPGIEQRILDFALVPAGRRRRTLRTLLKAYQPDVVAFSWRNMQTFGPHPENEALDVVMNFDYSPNPFKRLKSAFSALGIIYDYAASRINNFAFMRLVRRHLPEATVVVGGTAVSIFGKYVIQKCPSNSVVVIGEGEPTMLSIVDGDATFEGHYYTKDREGNVVHHPQQENFELESLTAIDFEYIESIFPGFKEYLGQEIGIHTKRGCPFQCHFCLYNKIEGPSQRYRDPVEIVKEIETLNKVYGVKKIWFTDAQFCSTRPSMNHVEKILDEMIARKVRVRWAGYLRLNFLNPEIAKKMLLSGLDSIDLSFTGTQEIIDRLTLGYKLKQQMEAFNLFKEAGHTDQKIKLYMPLNAPGETEETLLANITKINELYSLFGRDNVLPFIFFIGVQPGTPIEDKLLREGYLKQGYNPLTYNPFTIKRLLYNPEPLGKMIGRAYLKALDKSNADFDYVGRVTMKLLEEELQAREPS